MGTKVKGLMRGLKYFSNMFEEKEKEIEIGFPTDVKHVAHIGWDGPSVNSNNNNPSWMKEFNSADSSGPLDASGLLDSSGPLYPKEEQDNNSTRPPSEGSSHKGKPKHKSRRSANGLPPDSPSRNSGEVRKHSKRQESGDSPRSSDAPKHSRRNRSSNRSTDSREGSVRSTRRSKLSSSNGSESPSRDDQPPCIPRHSRPRKSKGLAGETSRSKDRNSSGDSFSTTDNGSKGSESVNEIKDTAI